MKGIFLKNLYVLLFQQSFLVITAVLYVFIGVLTDNMIMLMASFFYPIIISAAIQFDTAEPGWKSFECCLPCSENKLILAKYISALIFKVFALLIIIFTKLVRYLIFEESISFENAMLVLIIVFLFDAVNYVLLPLTIKYYKNFGGLSIILSSVIFFVISALIFSDTITIGNVHTWFAALAAAIWIIAALISYRMSVKIHRKCDF